LRFLAFFGIFWHFLALFGTFLKKPGKKIFFAFFRIFPCLSAGFSIFLKKPGKKIFFAQKPPFFQKKGVYLEKSGCL
jgi:hypothetical protein